LLDFGNQRTGNPSPPIVGMNGHPVNVSSPAVERPNDRTDHSLIDLGYQDVGGATGDSPSQVARSIRDAGSGIGLPPEFENRVFVLDPAGADAQAAVLVVGHHRLRSRKCPHHWDNGRVFVAASGTRVSFSNCTGCSSMHNTGNRSSYG